MTLSVSTACHCVLSAKDLQSLCGLWPYAGQAAGTQTAVDPWQYGVGVGAHCAARKRILRVRRL